ncbi:pyrroloquinoline quinone biosynthesis protein PqqB [Deinococcus koreensis]|uniref:Coenzyme PQQ synthesis protein B n=1 Tax=Deinococcus koreensis TaxID=2054903 RepID=A0A2K3UW77_9DEIO|nr:MBL fold metallo-hydrolase [Deinococcus koreensis]PNY80788.1 pyrroloquinoline quinone biosynthesis protein PqqB [Deinococcus koreensis]
MPPDPTSPTFLLLGTAAGGGLPQWNCGCRNCARVRAGELPARTQSSAAFTPDGERWYLIDASPDVARQLLALGPPRGRSTPLAGVLLTDAEFDHTLGLLQLREGSAWELHATPGVHALLEDQFPVRRLLSRYAQITPVSAPPGEPRLFGDLEVTWVALDDHTPRYHHGRRPEAGATSALRLRGPRRTLVYAPSLSTLAGPVPELLASADVLLVDGTFYHPDELIRLGLGTGDAASMGHLPVVQSAPTLARLPAATKLYTHLNNTNPALDPASPERAWLRAQGLDLADDGWFVGL